VHTAAAPRIMKIPADVGAILIAHGASAPNLGSKVTFVRMISHLLFLKRSVYKKKALLFLLKGPLVRIFD